MQGIRPTLEVPCQTPSQSSQSYTSTYSVESDFAQTRPLCLAYNTRREVHPNDPIPSPNKHRCLDYISEIVAVGPCSAMSVKFA